MMTNLAVTYLSLFFNRGDLKKKAKVGHYTAEIVVEILDRNGKLVPIRCLLDTGTTSSILLRDFVKKGRASGYSGKKTLWKTMGGNFTTKKKALVDFKFPELNIDKMVTWVCHVDESTKKENALYDMIIGVDLMTAIGIYVDTNDKVIRWEGNHTPLGMRGLDQETVNAIYALTQDTPVIQEAEARQSKILDADYSAVDIDDYVDGLTDLTTIEKEQLKIMLHKHPELFQGGLGVLDVPPVHLELNQMPNHTMHKPIQCLSQSRPPPRLKSIAWNQLECSKRAVTLIGQHPCLSKRRKQVMSGCWWIFGNSMI